VLEVGIRSAKWNDQAASRSYDGSVTPL